MKTKTQILTLLAILLAPVAHANLVTLVAEDANDQNFVNEKAAGELLFFDSYSAVPFRIYSTTYPPAWTDSVSPNPGALQGGTYFNTALEQTGPETTTTISWNFAGTDFWLSYIQVISSPDNPYYNSFNYVVDLYRIPYADRFLGDSSSITAPTGTIQAVIFWGTNPAHVPEQADTAALLLLALSAVLCTHLLVQHRT